MRTLIHFVIAVGSLALFMGHERVRAQDRAIWPFKAKVVKVHEKGVELAPIDRVDDIVPRKPIHFDVAEDTRFEEVDFKVIDGKLQLTRKKVALADLLPTQPISVIALKVGDRPTILVGVVAGEKVSGAEALKRIAKLGGKARNAAWMKEQTLYEVDLSDSKVTDDDLLLLSMMDDLYYLNLSNTKISNKGIAHLAHHANLSDVILSGTKVTNEVLTHLSTLPKLDRVSVDQTAVTGLTFLQFAKKKGLRTFCHIGAGAKCEYRIHEELRRGEPPFIYLMKRNTYYARFYPEEAFRRKATTYYHRNGPVGEVLRPFEWFPQDDVRANPSDARLPVSLLGYLCSSAGGIPISALACAGSEPAIGVVELNGGTIAAYGRNFQTIDFYNDIPELKQFNIKIDGKTPPFGFIEDARSRGTNVRVIAGAFKKTVRKDAPRGFYSAIFVDITVQQRDDPKAITKDDVHFDLLTQEGLRDLMDKTTPNGLVCYHTSHRSHDFYKPLTAAAAALGFSVKKVKDDPNDPKTQEPLDLGQFSSEWLVIARRPQHLPDSRRKNPEREI